MNEREQTLWKRASRIIAIAACIACSSCTTAPQGLPKISLFQSVEPQPHETRVTLTANVDGSGRFVFTANTVRYVHKSWSPPTDVKFNGEPWANLDQTPKMWPHIAEMLDLSRARLVERKGRDTLALEHTPEGFDLYLCDAPNGAAPYAATIAMPRRTGK